MIDSIENKKKLLMFGLFAVVGFNMSLNPESVEIRRTIASQGQAKGQIDLASEDQLAPLSMQLSDIFESYKRTDATFIREAVAVRDQDSGEVKYIQAKFKITEGKYIDENCEACKEWKTVRLDANLWSNDSKTFKSNVDQRLAVMVDQMRDSERSASKDRPVKIKDSISDDCADSDLTCKGEHLDRLAELCNITKSSAEADKVKCNRIIAYYASKIEGPLRTSLVSDSKDVRDAAATLRNKILELLPWTSEPANKIRMELIARTREGITTQAQKIYDEALKEIRNNPDPRLPRTEQTFSQYATRKVQEYMQSEFPEFGWETNGKSLCRAISTESDCRGKTSDKGYKLWAGEFEAKLKNWKPNTGSTPFLNGAGQKIGTLPNGRPANVVPCQGASCPRGNPNSFFPTPNNQIQGNQQPRMPPNYSPAQVGRPYTGGVDSQAPGTPFQRPN